MNFGLLIFLMLLVAPITVLIGSEWFPWGKHRSDRTDNGILTEYLNALHNEWVQLPIVDETIALKDLSLVDNNIQKLETGLGVEKKMTERGLKELVEQLPHNFIQYSNGQWVNRHWIQKIETDGLELFNGRKIPSFEEEL